MYLGVCYIISGTKRFEPPLYRFPSKTAISLNEARQTATMHWREQHLISAICHLAVQRLNGPAPSREKYHPVISHLSQSWSAAFSQKPGGVPPKICLSPPLPRDRHKASLCLSRVSTRPLTMVEGLGLTANILGIIVAADVVFRSTANLCDLLNRARTRPPPCHNSSMLLKVSFLPSLRCGFGPMNTNNSSLQAKMADVSPAKIISTLNRCGGQLNALVEEL